MLRKISNLFFKIVSRKAFFGFFERGINELKSSRCRDNSDVHSTAIFYETAEVINTQNDKNKIIIGANTHIRGKLLIFAHGGEIKIGNFCYIGENTHIWSADSIIIGNRILISHGVNIHDNNSHPTNSDERHDQFKKIISTGHVSEDINIDARPIVIEDDAWIGFNATILKGVTIGRGAIVGACSVVTRNVEPYSVVIGNPAQVIKTIPENER